MSFQRKYFIFHWDSFDIDFANYVDLQNKNKEFSERIINFLYKKELPVKETWNTYRAINHWTASWLIEEKRDDLSKWRKFNLREALWIWIISELRKFDLSIEKIKTVKECILWGKGSEKLFEYYVMLAYLKKKEVSLLVFENWEADFTLKHETEITEIMNPSKNFLSVSFTGVLDTVLQRILPRNNHFSITLNETEKSLFYQMSKNWAESIEYRISSTEGRIKKFKKEEPIIQKLQHPKEVNLISLTRENPDSQIRIYTNNESKITNIEVRKSD